MCLEDAQRDIRHRLKVAGQSADIFTEGAIRLIYEHSGGIPRRMNHLCDICLLSGFSKEAEVIDEQIVREEIR